MDHLYDRDSWQSCAEIVMCTGGQPIADLNAVGTTAVMLRDNFVNVLLASK
jgi:hypothetical protein